MIVVNIFGGPGAGKSTTAAGLFYKMKQKGLNVELVTEYAKDMTWEGRMNILGDQLYVLAKQQRRVARLVGKVDYVVTDAPFFLGLVYMEPDYLRTFEPLVLEAWDRYENHCFMLNRKNIQFQEVGRNQDAKQALEIDNKLHRLLNSRRIPFTEVVTSDTAVDEILDHLKID